MNIEQELRGVLLPRQIKTALIDRVAYASDAGFYQLIPQAVVIPENEGDITGLFRFSSKHLVPLVFRAAGTSLSGQSITDGIMVDIGKKWGRAQVLQDGAAIKVEPGIIGSRVNQLLAKYGRKIGPDPASINAAMMGGILSNNASGMCCGVAHNSYHTLLSLRFILPNGNAYDTSEPAHYSAFERNEPALFVKLAGWRNTILNDRGLLSAIRRKYRMKNTVGYGLNAFVDYEHPLDILAHLMIGAEGTLGFISHAVLQTIPDNPFKTAAMLYFPGIYEACSAIGALKEAGAEALELMDRSALRSVEHLPGLPDFFRQLPNGAAALLCEFQSGTADGLQGLKQNALNVCANLPMLHPAEFTGNEKDRMFYWKIRKGMFPSVGAVRQRGTSVLLEDIAFPVEKLADALIDLQKLFVEFDYTNAIIFGHAREGNIHFVVTQLLNTTKEINRYDKFMRKVVQLVLEKYDGALKAEHGTGRNMAPFVEAEWGGVAYRIMQELKQAIDPDNLLNPGVIINPDKEAHLKNLKQMPGVEEEVDKCIECGFCEHHCPSRDVTLTPRQRIQVRRQLEIFKDTANTKEHKRLLAEFQYAGLDTCATDGLCQVDCPVGINTGELVKRLRAEKHGAFANQMAGFISKRFSQAEWLVRALLYSGNFLNRLFGKQFLPKLTIVAKKVFPNLPQWWPELQKPPARISHVPARAQYVYLSACIQRMMGNDAERGSVQSAMLRVAAKAGVGLRLPTNLPGHCCGQAFSSKGYFKAALIRQRALIDALWDWTENGALPVVCDFTSCTYTLLMAENKLDEPWKARLKQLKVLDSIQFLHQVVLPRIQVTRPKSRVVLHPGCAATKLQLIGPMEELAGKLSGEVVIPLDAGCCGMAGDRGFLFPELTEGATRPELSELLEEEADGYFASAKTCEMALSHFSRKPYRHLVYLMDETTN